MGDDTGLVDPVAIALDGALDVVHGDVGTD